MTLSEYERRILAELERDLLAEDPALARKLVSGRPPGSRSSQKSINTIAAVTGLILTFLGTIAQLPVVGFIGFLLLLAGVLGFFVRRRNPRPG